MPHSSADDEEREVAVDDPGASAQNDIASRDPRPLGAPPLGAPPVPVPPPFAPPLLTLPAVAAPALEAPLVEAPPAGAPLWPPLPLGKVPEFSAAEQAASKARPHRRGPATTRAREGPSMQFQVPEALSAGQKNDSVRARASTSGIQGAVNTKTRAE